MDKCRTEKVNPVFSYIVDLERIIAETKSGTSLQNLECAALVENIGVEPTTFPQACGTLRQHDDVLNKKPTFK
jgi:hypothetical protein